MATKILQRFFYFLMFGILFAAIYLFILRLTSSSTTGWYSYGRIYTYALLASTWLVFILLFIEDTSKKVYPKYAGEKISVIMPCFNESLGLLLRSIESVINAEGNKEIIIIDDGSTNSIRPYLTGLGRLDDVDVHFFTRNQGKRHALHYAVKEIIQNSKFVVTIDSDTVLDPKAFIKVVEPLKLANIGAATGDVRILNEKQNILTRMIATYYWIGLNI